MRYHEAQTDDALLARAVVQSALSLGAELAMPASFTRATLTADAVAVVYDQNGSSVECTARGLVNAAGPAAPHVADAILAALPIPYVDLRQEARILLPFPGTA